MLLLYTFIIFIKILKIADKFLYKKYNYKIIVNKFLE
jgi:hypothetical protein